MSVLHESVDELVIKLIKLVNLISLLVVSLVNNHVANLVDHHDVILVDHHVLFNMLQFNLGIFPLVLLDFF